MNKIYSNIKNMKSKIIAVLSSIMLGIMLIGTSVSNTGCSVFSGVSTNAVQLAQIGAAVKTAAQDGTVIALQKDPSSRIFFVAASATLTELLSSTNNIDPSVLANALEKLPADQLQSPAAQIALTTIIGLYNVYYQQSVSTQLNSNLIASTLINNLLVGIKGGLAIVPAPAAPANFKLATPESFGLHLVK